MMISIIKKVLPVLFLTVLALSCSTSENPPDTKSDFVIGKNYFTTEFEGETRSYYVHVPSGYDPSIPTPVVYMLHGTSGDGLKFYNISGWKEVGEEEGIITVYPSSGRYCVIKDGNRMNTTKWSVYKGNFTYCQGEQPLDDIGFLRLIEKELKERYAIDEKRVYIAGFSNGGGMAFRCAVEMSDIFAAVVMASVGPSGDTTKVPLQYIPLTYQGGTIEKFEHPINLEDFDDLMTSPSEYHLNELVQQLVTVFNFRSEYSRTGDINTALTATFKGKEDSLRTLRFILINELQHNYPNGKNHPYEAAKENWAWFKQFSK